MATSLQSILRYWRASLADGALGEGKLRQRDRARLIQIPKDALLSGKLAKTEVDRIFESADALKTMPVRLWPLVTARTSSHGTSQAGGLPEIVAPVVTEATVDRGGRILPRRNTLARDILAPLPGGEFSIGTVAALDEFLTEFPLEVRTGDGTWEAYLAHCRKMIDTVAQSWPRGDDEYQPIGSGLLEVGEGSGAMIRQILDLYDKLLAETPNTPLLSQIAEPKAGPKAPDPAVEDDFARRLGHSNPHFPLAAQQKQVLAWLGDADADAGEVIAVNGPPGTGKTTMLLSAVAGLWVRAALKGEDPPVIVAASTNNQAVTNIIDAFGKDFAEGDGPFAGRWLPDIASFGMFLASHSRKLEAAQRYQTEDFQIKLETQSYFLKAKEAYLEAARAALPGLSPPGVGEIVSELHRLIVREADKLSEVDHATKTLEDARAVLRRVGGEDPGAKEAGLAEMVRNRQADLKRTRAAAIALEEFTAAESSLTALFAFLSFVEKKRVLRARLAIGDQASGLAECTRVEQIDALLRASVTAAEAGLRDSVAELERLQGLRRAVTKAEDRWAKAVVNLDASASADIARPALDDLADCGVRFRLFLLATHYWEGRWLLEMENDLAGIIASRGKSGKASVLPRWKRRMMLTPCAVATFASLPGKMSYSRYAKKTFDTEYLLDFIDLLIVDEAGQVLPEVAGASFSLAKRALVIGDTQQIEPISSVPHPVDLGNLHNSGLLTGNDDKTRWDALTAQGLCSTGGSAMRLAQSACRVSPYPELERGLYLFEHRRCYDEIIGYCNTLCYKGKLRPLRGKAPDDAVLPALGYLHIDGRSISVGSSRANLLEAQTIAAWLAANRAPLEARYGRKLEQIVGVITPFGRQVREIRNACARHKIVVGGRDAMTIGTVHALQGAERPIVIFSPVYSKHADGAFIDASPSMLNVTVSRAKDSCLVFGDMDVFSAAVPGSPRGLMAGYLFASTENALEFDTGPRADLRPQDGKPQMLRDAAEHDAFLLRALAADARRIRIVSPWVVLRTMQNTGILDAMREAIARGTKIDIYADPLLNAAVTSDGRSNMDIVADALDKIGARLHRVNQLHSKVVAVDDDQLSIGSFNWLSADRHGKFARHETSFVYRGTHLEPEITTILESLRSREA